MLKIAVMFFAMLGGINNTVAQDNTLRVTVLDRETHHPIKGAWVISGNDIARTRSNGKARLKNGAARATITVAYVVNHARHHKHGKHYAKRPQLKRLATFHDIPVANGHAKLFVNNGLPLRREATFSLSAPFGGVPEGASRTGLLPLVTHETAGTTSGQFSNIQVLEDQLQDDGLYSIMMVAFDEFDLPWKYGYLLDQAPALLEGRFLSLRPPMATPMSQDTQALAWRKNQDAIDPSNPDDGCFFTAPPYTFCGVSPPQGLFSWTNVWRKGVVYRAPGAFLPARTQGANPTMPLPGGINELVGHDEPLGFFPMNFSRHHFDRFNEIPGHEIEINMPNVLIGEKTQAGAEAIDVMFSGRKHHVSWSVAAGNDDLSDADAVDYGELEMIWQVGKQSATVWVHTFASNVGVNSIEFPKLPRKIRHWGPNRKTQFVETTVTLTGSAAVDGFDDAWAVWQSGKEPAHMGMQAFDVSRWR